MGDPLILTPPVEIEMNEALGRIQKLLAEDEDAATPYSESYENPHLFGSPVALLEAAAVDAAIRETHGPAILVAALTRIVAAQQERIEQLERRGAKK